MRQVRCNDVNQRPCILNRDINDIVEDTVPNPGTLLTLRILTDRPEQTA